MNECGAVSLEPSATRGSCCGWWVNCPETMIKRMSSLAMDPVIPPLLKALNQIRGILLPESFPGETETGYWGKAPVGTGTWFVASELYDIQSLRNHKITVMDLWNAAVSVCGILEQLSSLGIWGFAGRETVLLQGGNGIKGGERVCLTDITDYHIYRFPQSFPKAPVADKDPVTAAFRLLLGEVALCVDRQSLSGTEMLYSPLEEQLGVDCVGEMSRFFRTPSQLTPQQFLQKARSTLTVAANRLQLSRPQELHLYIVLLGTGCRHFAVPALSGVVRAFQRCLESLGEEYTLPEIKMTCLFPWNSVQICDLDSNVIPAISALTQMEALEKPVSRGGLLDCLDQEIERNMYCGSAPLVCYIEVPERENTANGAGEWSLNCMEQYFIWKLKEKQRLDICKFLLCGSDIRQPTRLMDYLGMEPMQVVSKHDELGGKMYFALKTLLERERYFCRAS